MAAFSYNFRVRWAQNSSGCRLPLSGSVITMKRDRLLVLAGVLAAGLILLMTYVLSAYAWQTLKRLRMARS